MKCEYFPRFSTILFLPHLLNFCSATSINCVSSRSQIEKCTREVRNFQKTHANIDGNLWLEPGIAREIDEKCHVAMNCVHLLGNCSIFEEDDLLWLEDYCDSYQFLISDNFYECALLIDKHFETPCVQHYLVNSPYFLLSPRNRCEMLESDGKCVKEVIGKTCSTGQADVFQGLLNRQFERLSCGI